MPDRPGQSKGDACTTCGSAIAPTREGVVACRCVTHLPNETRDLLLKGDAPKWPEMSSGGVTGKADPNVQAFNTMPPAPEAMGQMFVGRTRTDEVQERLRRATPPAPSFEAALDGYVRTMIESAYAAMGTMQGINLNNAARAEVVRRYNDIQDDYGECQKLRYAEMCLHEAMEKRLHDSLAAPHLSREEAETLVRDYAVELSDRSHTEARSGAGRNPNAYEKQALAALLAALTNGEGM